MNAALKQSVRSFVYARPFFRDAWLALQRARHRLQYFANYGIWDWCFDRWHGLETAGFRPPNELSVKGPHGQDATGYLPVRPRAFLRGLSSLPIDYSKYCFVDLGSGKGRAILLAKRYPFKRLIGVEFAKELHDAAVRNASHARPGKVSIEFVWADVLDFDFPAEPCVLYLFHPFGTGTMHALLSNVARSITEKPRDIILMYVNPEHEEVICSHFPDCRLLSDVKVKQRCVAYRLQGP
ncbi:MAG TPA: class I SAM-dependent methyltransferase [Terriglobales bacterium]|nr:class I SAM-dependent methyltransferase [Terriglobales bacterium]